MKIIKQAFFGLLLVSIASLASSEVIIIHGPVATPIETDGPSTGGPGLPVPEPDELTIDNNPGSEFVVSWGDLADGYQNLQLIEIGPAGSRTMGVGGGSHTISGRVEGEYSYRLVGEACTTTSEYEITICYSIPLAAKTVYVDDPAIAPAPAIVSSQHTSTIGVSSKVSHDGKLNLNIPLKTSEGVNGLGPKLALTYTTPRQEEGGVDSGKPGNFMGYGWNLGGLAYIERKDGSYWLNSRTRLVYEGNSRYRLQNNPNVRFIMEDVSGEPWFRMQSGGRDIHLGKTSGSRLTNDGSVTHWYMKKVKDAFGNEMTVDYVKTTDPEATERRIYPRFIHYDGHKIQFNYSYIDPNGHGALLLALNNIQTLVDGVLASEYRLDYGHTSGETHLSHVQRCGFSPSANPLCGQPTSINWETLPQDPDKNQNLPLAVNEIVDGDDSAEVSTQFEYVHETDSAFWGSHLFSEQPFDPQFPNYIDDGVSQASHSSDAVWVISSVSRSSGVGTMATTEYAYSNVSRQQAEHGPDYIQNSVVRKRLSDGTYVYTGYGLSWGNEFFYYIEEISLPFVDGNKVTNKERWTGIAGQFGSQRLSASYTHWANEGFEPYSDGKFYLSYPCLSAEFHVDGNGTPGQGKQISMEPVWNSQGLLTSKTVTVATGDVAFQPPQTQPYSSIPLPPSSCDVPLVASSGSEPLNLADSGYSLKTTTTHYDNDTTNWLIGFVSSETTERSNMPANSTKTITIDRTRLPGTLRAASVTEMAGTQSELTTSTTYGSYGNPTSVTRSGANVASRTVSYSDYLDHRYPQTTTNALAHETTYTYDSRFGVPATETGPNGLTVSKTRDNLGQVKRITQPGGTLVDTLRELCDDCPMIQGVAPRFKVTKTVTNPAASNQGAPETVTYHDKLGRVIRREHEGFAGERIKVDTAYDDLGRVYKQSLPYSSGTPDFTVYHYDLRNRQIQIDLPDGSVTTKDYDDLVAGTEVTTTQTIVRDGASKDQSRLEQYNILNQLVYAVDGYDSTDAVATEYRYDALGENRWTRVNSNANTVVTTNHNLSTHQRTLNDPNTGTTTFEMDALGQVTKQTDANGTVTTFSYDKLGRLTQRLDDATGDNPVTNSFTYDTSPNGIGLLAGRQSPGFTEQITYNAQSQVNQVSTAIVAGTVDTTYTTSLAYDAYGRVTSQTYPNGVTAKTRYNQYGYTDQLLDGNDDALNEINSLDVFGNVTQHTLGNGLVTNRTYDAHTGQLTGINTDNGTIQDNTYQWWSNGTLHTRENATAGVTETFTYDVLNRLTDANTIGTGTSTSIRELDYGYDALGNLTSKTGAPANYSYSTSQPHRLNTVKLNGDTHTLTYDAVGNIIQDDAPGTVADRHLTFNASGKPTAIRKGDASNPVAEQYFKYGPDGARFYKQGQPSGNETVYLYGGAFEVNLPASGTVTKIEKTQLGDVTHIREETLTGATERYEYSHRDHLGSVEVITDEAGNPVFNLAFDPFGGYRTLDWSSSGGNPTPLAQLLHTARGFTGHEQLDDVGLIHMNGRVYDPTLGRFMSADPIVQAPTYSQSYNRYSYVWNNPLGMTDPTGYQACWECYYSMRTTEALEGGAMMSELGPLMWAGTLAASQSSSTMSAPVVYAGGPIIGSLEQHFIPSHLMGEYGISSGSVDIIDCYDGCPGGTNVENGGVPAYDEGDPRFHKYLYDKAICSASLNPNCTIDNVHHGSKLYPVPYADGKKPVTTGDISDAQIGLVRHVVIDKAYTVVNVTLPNQHMLDPGKVVRTVYQKGSMVFMRTYGDGLGDWGAVNSHIVNVDFVWGGVNNDIVRYINRLPR